MRGKRAALLVADSQKNSNMYYAAGFLASDPFIFVRTFKESFIFVPDLELERAKKEAGAGKVERLSPYLERAKSVEAALSRILKNLGISFVVVPADFPFSLGRALEREGFWVKTRQDPFFKGRAVKTRKEIEKISQVQVKVEEVLWLVAKELKKSRIKDGFLYDRKGEFLTSERIRKIIGLELMARGCLCQEDTIVACGEQACQPHCLGSGPLKADSAIVVDVSPRSLETMYWTDITRTFVKGRASLDLKRLYMTVLEGQNKALAMVKQGRDSLKIDARVRKLFERAGYKTEKVEDRMQGFFHGLGHGVGLDIHEEPFLSKESLILKAGNVITLEPGLYYPHLGGVRIEDTVAVTEKGCLNLASFPKELMEL